VKLKCDISYKNSREKIRFSRWWHRWTVCNVYDTRNWRV